MSRSRARPLTLVNGSAPGPTLLITTGIHGGEYPSIEAAIRLAAELDPGEVSGTVIVVPIVSTESFQARQQYTLPSDGKNVNRQFPGQALGTVSERIAYTVASVVADPSREDGGAGGASTRPFRSDRRCGRVTSSTTPGTTSAIPSGHTQRPMTA